MTIPYVFLQMILSLEELLLVVVGADRARVTLVFMRGAMPKKRVSPCIRLPARWFCTSPRLMRHSLGVLVQFLKSPEQLIALLADMALLVVLVRTFRPGRRSRACRARLSFRVST